MSDARNVRGARAVGCAQAARTQGGRSALTGWKGVSPVREVDRASEERLAPAAARVPVRAEPAMVRSFCAQCVRTVGAGRAWGTGAAADVACQRSASRCR
eukprot:5819505-Prymnesium_polylepis.1